MDASQGEAARVQVFWRPSFRLKRFAQTVEERNLRRIDFATRNFVGEKFGAIDFGKGLHFTGARRPFHFEGVAVRFERAWQIVFEGPGVNGLAAFLFD
jgi:hypothetical protein